MTSQDHQFAMIVRWPHHRGAEAHCLGRLFPMTPTGPIGILSEVCTNPEGYDVGDDFASAAEALLRAAPVAVDPAVVRWIAHYGEFSYVDAVGAPETFTEVNLVWDGHYRDDINRHRQLGEQEAASLALGLGLEPVFDVMDVLASDGA